jgi:hypothetical protein
MEAIVHDNRPESMMTETGKTLSSQTRHVTINEMAIEGRYLFYFYNGTKNWAQSIQPQEALVEFYPGSKKQKIGINRPATDDRYMTISPAELVVGKK